MRTRRNEDKKMLYESKYYGAVGLGDSIMHYGVKGQKWGVRRYQNTDMSLTPEGRVHYGVGQGRKKTHSEKMASKYGLRESKPNKAQANDNAYDMYTSGASKREIKTYLKENGLDYNSWKDGLKNIKAGDKVRRDDIDVKSGKAAKDLCAKLAKNVKSVSDKDLPITPSKKAYVDAVNNETRIGKVEMDFYNNESLRNKYALKVADQEWPNVVKRGWYNDTKEDRAMWNYMWVHEDQDQGDSFDLYLKETRGEHGKNDYHKAKGDAELKTRAAREKYVKEVVGDHGDDEVTSSDPNDATSWDPKKKKWTGYKKIKLSQEVNNLLFKREIIGKY